MINIKIGEAFVQIVGRDGELEKSLYRAEKNTEKSVNRMDKDIRKIGDAFEDIAQKAALAFSGLIFSGKFFVDAASQSQELQNIIDISFGNMANAINDWSKDTADAMNRSTYQIRNFVGTSKAMIRSMVQSDKTANQMSKTITKLAVDLASFRNISDDRAFQALTGALTGNSEMLKTLGYNIQDTAVKNYALQQGIKKTYENMSIAEKTVLRYNLILERLSDVQGDARRTSESYANRVKALQSATRELRQELGKYLLPTFTEIVNNTTKAINWFNNLGDSTKKNIVRLGVMATTLTGVIAGISGAVSVVKKLITGVKTLSVGLSILELSFTPFAVGSAIVIGLATIYNYIKNIRKESELLATDPSDIINVDDAKKKLEALYKERGKLMREGVRNAGVSGAEDWIENNKSKEWESLTNQIEETKDRIQEIQKVKDEQKSNNLLNLSSIFGDDMQKQTYEGFSKVLDNEDVFREMNSLSQIIDIYKGQLEDLNNLDDSALTEEQSTSLRERLNDRILELEREKNQKIKSLDAELLDYKKRTSLSSYDYQIWLLDQEEKEIKSQYENLIFGAENYQQKLTEIEEVYNKKRQKIREKYGTSGNESSVVIDDFANNLAMKIPNLSNAISQFDKMTKSVADGGMGLSKTAGMASAALSLVANTSPEVQDALDDVSEGLSSLLSPIGDVISELGAFGSALIGAGIGFKAGDMMGGFGVVGGIIGGVSGLLGGLDNSAKKQRRAAEAAQKAAEKWQEILDSDLPNRFDEFSDLNMDRIGVLEDIEKLEKAIKINKKRDFMPRDERKEALQYAEDIFKEFADGFDFKDRKFGGSFAWFRKWLKESNADLEELNDKIEELSDNIKDFLGVNVSDLQSDLESAFSADTVSDFISNVSSNLYSSIRSALIKAFMETSSIKNRLTEISDSIFEGIGSALGDGTITEDEISGIAEGVQGDVDAIAEESSTFYKILERLGVQFEGLGATVSDVTESLTNVPTGFKVALTRFRVSQPAMNTNARIPSASLAGVSNISNTNQIDNSQPIVIQGDVYGYDDFKSKVNQARDESNRSRNIRNNGTPVNATPVFSG